MDSEYQPGERIRFCGKLNMDEMIIGTAPAQPIHRPWLLGLAWGTMRLISRLPQIVFTEFFAVELSFVWTWLSVALALTFWRPALQPLRGYLLIMAVMALVTGPFDAWLRTSNLWAGWFGQEQEWSIRFLGERLPLLIEALLLVLVLLGIGMKRHDFFLPVGQLRARRSGLG